MGDFESLVGTAKLADVLCSRIAQETEKPLVLDFGEIKGNRALVTNTFPVPIKKGDYSVCKPLIDGDVKLNPGMRVLVAWVNSEAVVIGTIKRS